MNLLKTLELVLKGGRVSRFHTKPLVKPETVAEHSYLVAWVATIMCAGRPSANLLLACLAHDGPEFRLGDVPSPTKRLMGMSEAFAEAEASIFKDAGLPDYERCLTPKEAEVLKFADNFAGWLKCEYERRLGNTLLRRTQERYEEYTWDQVKKSTYLDHSTVIKLFSTIKEGEM